MRQQNSNQSADMKKMEPHPKEKRKQDQKKN